MKLAITGKGGVGKTTLTALLAFALHKAGKRVVAIDADPNATLAACMGYPDPDAIRPLVEMKDLIEERTGVKPGTIGAMFRLNPFVADIPEKFAVDIGGISVLVAGGIKKGGAGCYCPENALLRALISHLLVEPDVALVLDMEAGLEHLSRGTLKAIDALLVVTEPSQGGVQTARRIRKLAGDIGLKKLFGVGNKIRSGTDEEFLKNALPDWEFAGCLPYDEGIRAADLAGQPVWEGAGRATTDRVRKISNFVSAKLGGA
jgi:CO dehydrogenase maturation factor